MPIPAAALTGSNYIGILVGERPMGMGGAYAAVSDDPSGLYYNPAGIVYGHAPNLSASVNAYHITSTRYSDALGEGSDWERDSEEFLPNFFGTTQPLGPVTVGFSYATPLAVREQQSQTFGAQDVGRDEVQLFSVNVDNSDTINEIGPSVAIEINDRLAVGATIYAHQREQQTIMTQVIDLKDDDYDDYELQTVYQNREQLGLSWVAGAVFAPTERLSLGISVRGTEILSATNEVKGVCRGSEVQGDYEDYCVVSRSGQKIDPGEMTFVDTIEDNVRDSYPFETRAGLAWFASQRLLLAADVIHYTAVGGRQAVTNFAVGGEYYLSPDWAIRAGGYTDHTNTYPGATHHVDRYGGSLSLTRFTRNSSVSVGFIGSYGSGDARIVDVEDVDAAQNMTTTSFTLFLATSYSY
ncbi:OmpP1/FadL family transporter [Halorhodospira halochloris]|uniref:OmpP1/FadL family transporter n=1 Tax=Halorhodospira halochloris TaxID=1052 RepID=UPI001EE938BC|nr:outer membrane protein transport protein [Halorhodospira halochloris]